MAEIVQTQAAQSDDLTAIFGSLGADIQVPPAEPDDVVEETTETPEEPSTPEAGETPVEDGAAEKPEVVEDSPPPVKAVREQPHIPPAVAKQLRQDRRDLQEKLAQEQVLRARAEARAELLTELHQKGAFSGKSETAPQPAAEKSPLEKFAEEFPDEPAPVKVQIEQENWRLNQAQAQTRRQEVESRTLTLSQQVAQGIQEAKEHYGKLGEGLGLDDVVGLAKAYKLITQEQLEALSPQGIDAGSLAYELSKKAILRSGGPAAAELARRVAVARSRQTTSTSQPVNGKQPKPKTNAPAASAKGGTPQDDSGISDLAKFICG